MDLELDDLEIDLSVHTESRRSSGAGLGLFRTAGASTVESEGVDLDLIRVQLPNADPRPASRGRIGQTVDGGILDGAGRGRIGRASDVDEVSEVWPRPPDDLELDDVELDISDGEGPSRTPAGDGQPGRTINLITLPDSDDDPTWPEPPPEEGDFRVVL
jgi:hypothetical protein